jgi:hypothetical protein
MLLSSLPLPKRVEYVPVVTPFAFVSGTCSYELPSAWSYQFVLAQGQGAVDVLRIRSLFARLFDDLRGVWRQELVVCRVLEEVRVI